MKIFILLIGLLAITKSLFPQKDSLVISKWNNGFPKEVKIILPDSSYRLQKYYSSGLKHCITNYNKAGRLNGSEKCWFEWGTIKSESQWKNGINYGTTTLWYQSGQKSFEAQYLDNGAPEGAWKGWYENGQIQYEQYYSNGSKIGKWVNYKKDGGMEIIQYYESGVLVKEEKR